MNRRIPSLDEFINEAKATEQNLIGKKVSFQGADVCPIIDQGTVGELSKKYRDKMPKESQKQCDSFDQEENAVACIHGDKMVTIHSLADIASKSHQKIIESELNEGAKQKFLLYTNPNNVTNMAYLATGPDVANVLRKANAYPDSYEILYQGRGDETDINKAKETFSYYKFR